MAQTSGEVSHFRTKLLLIKLAQSLIIIADFDLPDKGVIHGRAMEESRLFRSHVVEATEPDGGSHHRDRPGHRREHGDLLRC